MQTEKVQFDTFVLDSANASLKCDGKSVALTPKVFAVLCFLIKHAGKLVTKDQLLDVVWQHRYVSESVLKDHISDLRQALGDQAKAPRYIETVPRRGYRFIAEVREIAGAKGGGDEGIAAALGFNRAVGSIGSHWVGRGAALERLASHWRRALSGERQVVLLSGEAGIGKTTLIDLFLNRIASGDVGTLRSRCIEHFGAGEAYLPLLEALSNRCRAPEGAALIARLRQFAPTWLVQMPLFLDPIERESLQREVLGATRERMLRELCEFLEDLSRVTPLVLVLDDLHWSDYATLDVISLIAQRRDPAALMILGSYRPVDVAQRGHPVAVVQQELIMRGLCTELRLDMLSPADVASYISLKLGGGDVADELAQAIYRHSEGHPLFMVNLVDYLIAEGRIKALDKGWTYSTNDAELGLAVPHNLKQMMERQLDSLSPQERRCIEAASVAGVEFSAALVATALGVDILEVEGECETLARREQWLKAAGTAEWPDGTVAGRYAFLHTLYIEVLYRRFAPAQCMRLHRSIGERLIAAYGENSGEVAAQVAMHFERARDYERAMRYLQVAAAHMARRWAYGEAIGYLDRALRLVERLPKADRAGARIDVLQQRAGFRQSMGNMSGAAEELQAMLANARVAADRSAEVRAMVDLSRVFVWLDRRRSLEWAAEALEIGETLDDEVMRAMVRANHAGWNVHFTGWREDYVRASRDGLAAARRTNNPRILNMRLPSSTILEAQTSNYRDACALAQEGMTVAASLGDGYHFTICQTFRIWALGSLGIWGEARSLIEKSQAAASRNENRRLVSARRLQSAWLYSEALDFQHAHFECEQALKLYDDPLDVSVYCLGRLMRARALTGLRRFADAAKCLGEITLRQAEGLLMDRTFYPLFNQDQCDLALAQGDLSPARQHAELLCEAASVPPERGYLALGHRFLAEIAMAEHEWEDAQTEITQALEIVTTAEVPLAAWPVYATAAVLAEQRGYPAESKIYRSRASGVLHAIADSLAEHDPLRAALAAIPIYETVVAT